MRSTLRWFLSVGLVLGLLVIPVGLALAHGGIDDGDEPAAEPQPTPAISTPAPPAPDNSAATEAPPAAEASPAVEVAAPPFADTTPVPEATAPVAEVAAPTTAAPMAEHAGASAPETPANTPATTAPESAAPAPAPTQLALRLERNGANQARAVAVLTEPGGQPLQSAAITFMRKSTFGQVSLATVRTNRAGMAAADLPISPGQDVNVTATFRGSKSWGPSEAGANLSVPAVAVSRSAGLYTQRPNPWFLAILLVVVGGVWLTYALVFFLLFRLSRARMPAHRFPVPADIPATSD